MEVVPSRRLNKFFLPLASLFLLLAGCMTTGSFLGSDGPASDICRVVVAWHPEVIFTPDPVHGGQPTPGLAGRVYLFGEQIDYPRVGDGSLVVDLYQEATTGEKASSVPLECNSGHTGKQWPGPTEVIAAAGHGAGSSRCRIAVSNCTPRG